MDTIQEFREQLALEKEKRIKAEQALETTSQWFELLLETADIGLWDWDMETNQCSFSRTYFNMLGYTPEDFPASYESWQSCIHPEDWEKTYKEIHGKIKTSGIFEVEFRFRDKSGGYQWILARGKVMELTENNEPKRVTGTHLNITERKLAEQKLAASERTLSSVLESLSDPIVLCDKNLGIVWSNQAAQKAFGHDGEALALCGDEYQRQACCPQKKEQIPDKAVPVPEEMEVSVTDTKGERRTYWRASRAVAQTEDQENGLFVVSFKDITERQAFQAEVTRSAQLASIGELAACIAHEINNPINGIINYAQMIKDESEELGLGTDESDTIIHEARRIAFIVKNLLNMTRSSEDQMSSADIKEVVEQSVGMIRMLLKNNNINVTTDIPAGLPLVLCNTSEIKQVLLNLLTNSFHALSGTDKPDKKITIRAESEREMVKLDIEDNGCGIPEKHLPHLFDPFYTTKPFGKGTGLGLHICRKIIQAHGGTVHIHSIQDQGTVVTVKIPVWSEE